MHTMTVKELKSWLEHLSDDDEVSFAGGLKFYRIKDRGGYHEIALRPHVCYDFDNKKWVVDEPSYPYGDDD